MSSDGTARRLGVMGGTFDPIHVGHLVAASEALWRFDLDRVIFVVAGEPWQKSTCSDAEDRYMMTMLGACDHPRFAVSRIELDRTGPTYTAETMESLRSFYGEATKLFFIAGADAALKLGTWEQLDRLATLAEVIALTRADFDLAELAVEPGWPQVQTMEMPAVAVSSTEVRARVAAGEPIDYLVPAAVVAYISEHGLYAEGASRA